jgi:AhpD family alkylhydroperoxidase
VARIPLLTPDQLDPAQRALYHSIVDGPRGDRHGSRLVDDDGALRGPFGPMLDHPPLGQPIQAIGSVLRFGGALRGDLRELAILVVATVCRCDYEWGAHAPLALAEGLTEPQVDAVRLLPDDPPPDLAEGVQQLVYRAARALALDRTLDDGTFHALQHDLGRTAAFELHALVGYYQLLALVLNSYDVRRG